MRSNQLNLWHCEAVLPCAWVVVPFGIVGVYLFCMCGYIGFIGIGEAAVTPVSVTSADCVAESRVGGVIFPIR